MKIQVGGLSEGIHQYHFHVEPSALGLSDNFTGNVGIAATMEKSGNQLHLRARIETLGKFDCDRCVKLFEKQLTPSYEMHYVAHDSEAEQFDPSEVQVISPGHLVIDMTEDVRQTIILSVPLKILCNDNCAGLCPHCAKNLNEGRCDCKDLPVDSRWEGLRRFMND